MAAAAAAAVEEIDSDVEDLGPTFSVDVTEELKEEADLDGAVDPDRIDRETEPWPPLSQPVKANLSERAAKAAAKVRQDTERDAAALIEEGNVLGAIGLYTEAMRASGATAMMLATRGALLLKQRRPCAAIRDCTAALKINASMVKAYRIRATAHRKLGHWRKAHRDLLEAQGLKFDATTAELQRLVAAQVLKLDIAAGRQASGGASVGSSAPPPAQAPAPAKPQVAPAAEALKDLDKGQAVVISGLQKAPHLNGKRGVVERCDPRPAAKGRWEVELRLEGGKLEIKSLKRENIMTLNKADKAACRSWASEEKKHRLERRQKEEKEEMAQYKKCFDVKLLKYPLKDRTKALLRDLNPKEALDVLDKVSDKAAPASVDAFVASQAKLFLGLSDSDEEPGAGKRAYDPEEEPPPKRAREDA